MRKSLLVKKTVQLQERDRFQKFKKCTIDYVKQELLKLNRNWTAIDELVAKISELINSFINMNQDAYSSLNETERDELKKTKYVLDELLDSRLNIAYLREKTSYAVRRAPGNLLNDEYLKELRERVRRENYCCMYDEVPLIGCPQNVSLEHFYPASKGGRTDKSSCYLVSAAANLHKYDLTPMDYMYIFHPEVGASWYIKRFNEIADSLIESKEKECATLEILYTLAHFIIKVEDEYLDFFGTKKCKDPELMSIMYAKFGAVYKLVWPNVKDRDISLKLKRNTYHSFLKKIRQRIPIIQELHEKGSYNAYDITDRFNEIIKADDERTVELLSKDKIVVRFLEFVDLLKIFLKTHKIEELKDQFRDSKWADLILFISDVEKGFLCLYEEENQILRDLGVKIDCIGRPAPKRYLEILNNPNLKRRDLTEIYNFE